MKNYKTGKLQFHFLLLAAGEVLKTKDVINAQDIQNFIQEDEAFGVRPPLSDCRLALQLLANSGFLTVLGDSYMAKLP